MEILFPLAEDINLKVIYFSFGIFRTVILYLRYSNFFNYSVPLFCLAAISETNLSLFV